MGIPPATTIHISDHNHSAVSGHNHLQSQHISNPRSFPPVTPGQRRLHLRRPGKGANESKLRGNVWMTKNIKFDGPTPPAFRDLIKIRSVSFRHKTECTHFSERIRTSARYDSNLEALFEREPIPAYPGTSLTKSRNPPKSST